jgi:hypothetical protein
MAQLRSRTRRLAPALLAVALGAAVVLAAGAPARATAGTPPLAETAPPATPLVLAVSAANGTGCTTANTRVVVHPDNTAFDLWIDDFEARSGPGLPPTAFRETCALAVTATVPAGYGYGIAEVTQAGRGALAPGVTATHRSGYHWCGCSGSFSFTGSFRGGFSGAWIRTDTPDWIRYSPCATPREMVNLHHELRVGAAAPGPAATVSRISLGGPDQPVATYRLAWYACG